MSVSPIAQQKVIDELHSHLRHNMQLWLNWFTFFVTVNYVAIGWFAVQLFTKNTSTDSRPLMYVSTLFIVQGGLGVWASLAWSKQLSKMQKDLIAAYTTLSSQLYAPEFSGNIYSYVIKLGTVALLVIAVAWWLIAIRP